MQFAVACNAKPSVKSRGASLILGLQSLAVLNGPLGPGGRPSLIMDSAIDCNAKWSVGPRGRPRRVVQFANAFNAAWAVRLRGALEPNHAVRISL